MKLIMCVALGIVKRGKSPSVFSPEEKVCFWRSPSVTKKAWNLLINFLPIAPFATYTNYL